MALTVITDAELAAWLSLDTLDAKGTQVLGLTNGLIEEEWISPVNPVPTSVKLMALEVAARGYHYEPGKGAVESITRSFDDSSRTVRYRATEAEAAGTRGRGIYLTSDDLAVLNGSAHRTKRVGSIRTVVPGFTDGVY